MLLILILLFLGMAELNNFAASVAVVVSSCDAFFDAWRPFAFFWKKFWPRSPFPLYLIVNQLRVRSSFILPLAVGEDRGWASNMKSALQMISQPHVLYLQEDYFLNGPVSSSRLAADLEYALEHNVDAFCFRARSTVEPHFQPLSERFGLVPPESAGRTRCQLTLWKREALLSVLRDGETAWEMESRGSERTREMQMVSYFSRENNPVPYLMSAIVRGLWTREAQEMCATATLNITPNFRGTYSPNLFLQRWRRAQTRSRLRAALAAERDAIIDLDAQSATADALEF